MRLLISPLNDLILPGQHFFRERTRAGPEPAIVVFNLDADNLCYYPEWLALLKDDMRNTLSGVQISKHDSLVIDGVTHFGLQLGRWGSRSLTESLSTKQKGEDYTDLTEYLYLK